jgi:hypothetical protein
MGQSTRIEKSDHKEEQAALGWARIAELVEIAADGSWSLTTQGLAGVTELLNQVEPVDERRAEPDRRRHQQLV